MPIKKYRQAKAKGIDPALVLSKKEIIQLLDMHDCKGSMCQACADLLPEGREDV